MTNAMNNQPNAGSWSNEGIARFPRPAGRRRRHKRRSRRKPQQPHRAKSSSTSLVAPWSTSSSATPTTTFSQHCAGREGLPAGVPDRRSYRLPRDHRRSEAGKHPVRGFRSSGIHGSGKRTCTRCELSTASKHSLPPTWQQGLPFAHVSYNPPHARGWGTVSAETCSRKPHTAVSGPKGTPRPLFSSPEAYPPCAAAGRATLPRSNFGRSGGTSHYPHREHTRTHPARPDCPAAPCRSSGLNPWGSNYSRYRRTSGFSQFHGPLVDTRLVLSKLDSFVGIRPGIRRPVATTPGRFPMSTGCGACGRSLSLISSGLFQFP